MCVEVRFTNYLFLMSEIDASGFVKVHFKGRGHRTKGMRGLKEKKVDMGVKEGGKRNGDFFAILR